MTYEILYTSAPQGLKPGSFGFCTVAASEGIPPPLLQRLESLSSYRHLYPPGHPRAALNPVNYAHLLVQVGGRRLHVLSRIADAGWDYSQRTNKLAHHVVLEESECIPPGPAWLLAQPGFCLTQFSGSPRILPPNRPLPPGELLPARCVMWEQVTGDAGWAGVLVRQALEKKQSAYLIFREGMELLPLLLEAQALLPPKERWEVTFSTYYTRLPPGVDCLWRCVLTGSAEAQEAQNARSTLVLDLTRPLGPAPNDPWTQAARDGLPAPRELLPASPSVGSSSSLLSMAAAGTIPPAPWDSSSPPLNLPGWSGIEPVSAANRNGLMAPPAPPPLAASRGSSWLAMAGGLLLGLFLGAAGAVIALRPPPPLPAVDQKVPDSQPLPQDTKTLAEPSDNTTENLSDTQSPPKSTEAEKLRPAETRAVHSPEPSEPTSDTRPRPNQAEKQLTDGPSTPSPTPQENARQQSANKYRNELGWPLDKLPKPQDSCVLADDLPDGTTIDRLSLLPNDLAQQPSSTDHDRSTVIFTIQKTHDEYHGNITVKSTSATPPIAATLKIDKKVLILTWANRIDKDAKLLQLLSRVIVCRGDPQPGTPMFIPIWRPYTINHTLRLRHCFPSEWLYSWNDSAAGPHIPCLTPEIFSEEDLYFRTTEAPNLFGTPDTGAPASGSLEQPSDYYKATEGVTWNHNIIGLSCPYRYTLKLQGKTASSQAETVTTGYTLWGGYVLAPQPGGNDEKLRKLLTNRDKATQLIRHKNGIELLVTGEELLRECRELSAKSPKKVEDNSRVPVDEKRFKFVRGWLEKVGNLKILVGTNDTSKYKESLEELEQATRKSSQADASQVYDQLRRIVEKVLDLLARQLVGQTTVTADFLEQLTQFRDIILSREEMFTKDGTGGSEVSVVLYRRVEMDKTKPPRYLPVIRFGEMENHEVGEER